jgi:hypothetical protein
MNKILTIPILCKQKKAHPLQDEKITKKQIDCSKINITIFLETRKKDINYLQSNEHQHQLARKILQARGGNFDFLSKIS